MVTRWKSKDTALQPCKHTCSDRNCFGFVLLVTLLQDKRETVIFARLQMYVLLFLCIVKLD